MVVFHIEGLDTWFGSVHALRNVSMDVEANRILSVIGPSNSGKTTLIRTLNRMNDLQPSFRMSGTVTLDGTDIRKLSAENVRRRVCMVFALPLPLPLSVFDNVAYGPRLHESMDKNALAERVETALRDAYLWDEVKDRLHESAFKLSGGQQQRLCIARTLAVKPEVIVFDEPCSGLDPISTAKVEDAMLMLKRSYTLVLVTNNVKQAARVGDRTAFFLGGELIEMDDTDKVFTSPGDKRTDGYIRGLYG